MSRPPRYVSLYLDRAIRLKGKPVGPTGRSRRCPAAVCGNDLRHKHWALPGKRRTVGRTRPVLRPRARRPASAGERSPSTWRPCEAREGRAFPTKVGAVACVRTAPHRPTGRPRADYYTYMTTVCNLGVPRIGMRRELMRAVEAYWRGDSNPGQLHDPARAL